MSEIKMREIKMSDEYRAAVSGDAKDGILNLNWVDKPHRLIYDLCNAYDADQAEIAALKEQIANMTLAKSGADMDVFKMSKLHNGVVAQVNELRDVLKLFHGDNFIYSEGSEYLEDHVIETLNKTPQQCLAQIKADAVKQIIAESYKQERFDECCFDWICGNYESYFNETQASN